MAHAPGFEIVAGASDRREAIELAEREIPHEAILDISMPLLNGLEAARQISIRTYDIESIMVTVHTDECYLLSSSKVGAHGYVLKSSAEFEIVDAVRAVRAGKAYLSPKVSQIQADEYVRSVETKEADNAYERLPSKERHILQLLAEGKPNKDITNLLDLSPTIVMYYRQHTFQKLKFQSRPDLIVYAIRKGVIVPQQCEMPSGV